MRVIDAWLYQVADLPHPVLAFLTMPDAKIPKFRIRKAGEPIPPVDPDDLRRRWNIKPPWTSEALQAAQSQEADSSAVSSRDGMIRLLTDIYHGQILAPWRHGQELDDAVFRVAATFPIRMLRHTKYMIAGDEILGFDPNAFLQRLIEETGISHVWKPIPTKISEGSRPYITVSFSIKGQVQKPDLERDAKRQARDLLWDIWSRFADLDRLLSHSDEQAFSDKEAFRLVTMLFDDFVADSHDLLPDVESAFRSGDGMPPLSVLTELERRAQGRT
jgi:hypothetical protein